MLEVDMEIWKSWNIDINIYPLVLPGHSPADPHWLQAQFLWRLHIPAGLRRDGVADCTATDRGHPHIRSLSDLHTAPGPTLEKGNCSCSPCWFSTVYLGLFSFIQISVKCHHMKSTHVMFHDSSPFSLTFQKNKSTPFLKKISDVWHIRNALSLLPYICTQI